MQIILRDGSCFKGGTDYSAITYRPDAQIRLIRNTGPNPWFGQ